MLAKVCKLLQEDEWRGLVIENGTKIAEANRRTKAVKYLKKKNRKTLLKIERLEIIKSTIQYETDCRRHHIVFDNG